MLDDRERVMIIRKLFTKNPSDFEAYEVSDNSFYTMYKILKIRRLFLEIMHTPYLETKIHISFHKDSHSYRFHEYFDKLPNDIKRIFLFDLDLFI